MAGWSSNSNWGLLGSMRASAQMISYEVTMGLSIVGLAFEYTGDFQRDHHRRKEFLTLLRGSKD